MKKYIMALDEGTTSTRSILFDLDGNVLASAQKEFRQIYPKPGWVEHDPTEIYASQLATMTEAIAISGVNIEDIACIGITNQRETTVVWDKDTGKPVYNAIVWQCRRTSDYCEELKSEGMTDYIRKTTGLVIDAYFSATKVKWILDNVEGAREMADRGQLLFGTIDTWLTWKMTKGKVHVTDRTNASRTMLYDINKLDWDETLLKKFNIPRSMLPDVRSSGELYGYVDVLGYSIPISGIAGDQQAALFGHKCFNTGEGKNTYGTGCFLLMNTGSVPCDGKKGMLATIAASDKNSAVNYAAEGSVFVGGAVIQWLRDELGVLREANDSEYFAEKAKDSGGVYVVPAFAGLGAPYWDMYARGVIVGMTRGSGRNQIIRASLEAIAYQSNDVIKAMELETKSNIKVLKADGGASSNKFLMQFQSDISNVDVIVPSCKEATALGAAYLAGLGCGLFSSRDEIPNSGSDDKFSPQMSEFDRERLLKGWRKAIDCASGWVDR
ncbi:MAG: glycerol kinase GlpK [Clostridiales bacterium]|nr:glycerol kinase GlpK [Clostridiales bacterium]